MNAGRILTVLEKSRVACPARAEGLGKYLTCEQSEILLLGIGLQRSRRPLS